MKHFVLLALFGLFVSSVLAEGTLYADEVLPVPPSTVTSISAMRTGESDLVSIGIGAIDAHNPDGFQINTNGTIEGNVGGKLSFSGAVGIKFGNRNTVSNAFNGNVVNLKSTRTDVATQTLLNVNSGGDLLLSANEDIEVLGNNVNFQGGSGTFVLRGAGADATVRAIGRTSINYGSSANLLANYDIHLNSNSGNINLSGASGSINGGNVFSHSQLSTSLLAGGNVNVNAFSVVDWDGGLLNVRAVSIGIASSTQGVNLGAESVLSSQTLSSLYISAGNDITYSVNGDSESRIDVSSSQFTSYTANRNFYLLSSGDGADIIFEANGNADFSGPLDFNLAAEKEAHFKTLGAVRVTSGGEIDFFSGEDIALQTDTSMTFTGNQFIEGSFAYDIDLYAGAANINSAGTLSLTSGGDMLLQSRGLGGSVTFNSPTLNINADNKLSISTLDLQFQASVSNNVKGNNVHFQSGLNKDFIVSATQSITYKGKTTSATASIVDFTANTIVENANSINFKSSDGFKTSFLADTTLVLQSTGPSSYTSTGDMFFATGSGTYKTTAGTTYSLSSTVKDINWESDNGVNLIASNTASWKLNAANDWNLFAADDVNYISQAISIDTQGAALPTINSFAYTGSSVTLTAGDITFGKGIGLTQASATELDKMEFFGNSQLQLRIQKNILLESGRNIVNYGASDIFVYSQQKLQINAQEQADWRAAGQTIVKANTGDINVISSARLDITAATDISFTSKTAFTINANSNPAGSVLFTSQKSTKIQTLSNTVGSDININGGDVLLKAVQSTVTYSSAGNLNVEAGYHPGEGRGEDINYVAKRDFKWTGTQLIRQSASQDINVNSFANSNVEISSGNTINLSGGFGLDQSLNFLAPLVSFGAAIGIEVHGKVVEYRPTIQTSVKSGQSTNTDSTQATSFTMQNGIVINVGNDFSSSQTGHTDITGSIRVLFKANVDTSVSADNGDMTFTSGGPTSVYAGGNIRTYTKSTTRYSAGRAIYWTLTNPAAQNYLRVEGARYNLKDTSIKIQAIDGQTTLAGDSDYLAVAQNDVSFWATNDINVHSNGGVVLATSGKSTLLPGDTNLGIAVHTTDEQGHIVYDSQYDRAIHNGALDAKYATQSGSVEVFADYGVKYMTTNANMQVKATSGRVDLNGGTGFYLRAGKINDATPHSIKFSAGHDMDVFSEDSITMISRSNKGVIPGPGFNLLAQNGHVRIASGNQKDISAGSYDGSMSIRAGGPFGVEATATRNFNIISGQDQYWSSGKTYSLTTINGPITFDATNPAGGANSLITFQAFSKYLHLDAGHNIIHASGNDISSIAADQWGVKAANGSVYIAVTKPGSILAFSAGRGMDITSQGDRLNPRDHVYFKAAGSVNTITAVPTNLQDSVTLWANNLIEVGYETRPNVKFFAQGGATSAGFAVTSQGNALVNSDMTFTIKASGGLNIQGDRVTAFSTDGPMTIFSGGLKSQADSFTVVSEQGSIHLKGQTVSIVTSGGVQITAQDNLFMFSQEGVASYQAVNNVIESVVGNIAFDEAHLLGSFSSSVVLASDAVDIATVQGENGNIQFVSGSSFLVEGDGGIIGSTALNDATLLFETFGNSNIYANTKDPTSTILFASGRYLTLDTPGNVLIDSTNGRIDFNNEIEDDYPRSSSDFPSTFNITATTGDFNIKAANNINLEGWNGVILGSVGTKNSQKSGYFTKFGAQGKIDVEAEDEQNYQSIKGTVYLSTTGQIEIDSDSNSVNFLADRNVIWTAKQEIEWIVQGNIIGQVDTSAGFFSWSPYTPDSHGIKFNTQAAGGDLVFESRKANFNAIGQNGVLLRANDAGTGAKILGFTQGLIAGLGTDKNGNGVNVRADTGKVSFSADLDSFVATGGGAVSLAATSKTNGVVEFRAFGTDDLAESAIKFTTTGKAGNIVFQAFGDESNAADNTDHSIIGAAFGDILVHAYGTGVNPGEDGYIRIHAQKNPNVVNADSGILFSTNPKPAITPARSNRKGDIVLTASGDVSLHGRTIQLNSNTDTAAIGGDSLHFLSSGPLSIQASEVVFTSTDSQAGIIVAVDPNSQDADINLYAQSAFNIVSFDTTRVITSDPSGTDIDISTDNGALKFTQYGNNPQTRIGIDVHALNGDLVLKTHYGGDVVFSAASTIEVDVEGAFQFQSTTQTPNNFVGTHSLQVTNTNFNLQGGSSFSLSTLLAQTYSSPTIEMRSLRNNIEITALGALAFSASAEIVIAAHQPQGDIYVETYAGGSITFNPGQGTVNYQQATPTVSHTVMNPTAHFLISATSHQVTHNSLCQIPREMLYVTYPELATEPVIHGYPELNAGQNPLLCICDNANFNPARWQCVRLVTIQQQS